MITGNDQFIEGKNGLSEAKRQLIENLLKLPIKPPLNMPSTIPRRALAEAIPLSFSQQQVWAHSQMVGDIPVYNEQVTIHFRCRLEVGLLERCLTEILRRHEIWRTVFRTIDGTPVQIVQPAADRFPLACTDLRHLPKVEREAEAARLAANQTRERFDLTLGPLLRAFIIRMEEAEYRLCMTFHQIIFDAFSAYRVFVPELSALYTAFSGRQTSPLSTLPLQYGDFASWQRNNDPNDVWSEQLSFWREKLSGELPILQWPSGRLRSSPGSYRGATERFNFGRELVRRLKGFCRQEGVSSYMALVASYAALMARYTGQEDIVIGGFSAGRTRPEMESLVGYFVNPLALRIDLSGLPTFRQLTRRVKNVVLDALANQDVPFQKVVDELHLHSDRGRNPIFQIAISQQPLLSGVARGWDVVTEEVSNGGSKMDMIAVIDERPDAISGPITYNPDLFERSSIIRVTEHWETLLGEASTNPDYRLSELRVVAPAEITRIVSDWNATRDDYPCDRMLHELIEAQAARTPGAVAVEFERQKISYRDLNARSNQLAHYLRRIGVGPDVPVGVCTERSAEMVVALLGVIKAGGAYVPLDPTYPKDRLAFLIEDCGAKVLVTEEDFKPLLSEISLHLVCLDKDWPKISCEENENPARIGSPEDLLYVIYTSGSTGKPKGVQVCHRAFVNLATSVKDEPGIQECDTLLALATISFDIAAAEIFVPLTVGARIIVASRQTVTDPHEIEQVIEQKCVTILQATPVTWRMLIDSGWQGNGRLKLICTGEALSRDLADQLLTRATSVWNMYGPTETTVWSTVAYVKSGADPIVIGRPIANTQVYILDKDLRSMPIGTVGELYIGGDGLARGYLNRSDLTAQRFLPNPFNPGTRLYKTGDLARFRSDGNIECLGRSDRQVKVRGYRIELDEIETALRHHVGVRDAIVILREDIPGNARLIGYIVLRDEAVSVRSIRDFLKQKLPMFMLPEIIRLDRLPLTPNGKLDRNSLPDGVHEAAEDEEFGEPSDETEKLLAHLWSEALKIDRISVYDNFFDLGGNSLAAIGMLARLQDRLGVRLRPIEVAFQTLGQLSALCKERLEK